jgi:hypothetical protein
MADNKLKKICGFLEFDIASAGQEQYHILFSEAL